MHKLTASLAVACLGCAAAALWFRHELTAEKSKTTSLESRLAQLERPHATIPPVGKPAESDASPSAHPSAANPHAAPVSSASASTETLEPTERWNAHPPRAPLQNPAFRDATRAQRKLQMGYQYVDLASALQVPPETATRLIELLADIEVRHLGEENAGYTNPSDMDARAAAVRESRKQEKAELVALLGEDGYGRWQGYQESLPTRYQMHDLREQLSGTAEPLRDDQLEPLIAAVHGERVRFNDEIHQYVEHLQPGQERDMRYTDLWPQQVAATHARIHASASSILSPVQLAQLDTILDELRRREAAQIQVERAMRDARARDKLNIAKSN